MTIDERIRRARWSLDSIESKSGAHDRGRLEVALLDAERAVEDLHAIWRELARRVDRTGAR